MNLNYAAYKNVRDGAWQCLIDNNITSLPVDLRIIARSAGIKIVSNKNADVLSNDETGKSLLLGDQWLVVYDDKSPKGRRRFTIAHEFGHIFLGHELVGDAHRRSFRLNRPQEETDADMFAARILAPACVLQALDIHSAEEIASLCGMSMEASAYRAERMEELYQRNKFDLSPLERAVRKQFKLFIEQKEGRG